MRPQTNHLANGFRSLIRKVCAATFMLSAQLAFAQADNTDLSRVDLAFSPNIVQAGVPNTITVSGVWNNGCVPLSAKLVESRFRVLITLQLPPANLGCTEALQPYKVVVPVKTFEFAGSYDLQVVTTEGGLLDSKSFGVQGAAQFFSEFIVAGGWYERSTSGSGLMLSHKRAGATDQLWGTWHNYTDAGKPNWYSLQGGRWSTARTSVGDIYETSANPFACTLEFPGDPNCPIPFKPARLAQIRKVGTYSIGFTSVNSADLIMRLDAGGLVTRVIRLERIQ